MSAISQVYSITHLYCRFERYFGGELQRRKLMMAFEQHHPRLPQRATTRFRRQAARGRAKRKRGTRVMLRTYPVLLYKRWGVLLLLRSFFLPLLLYVLVV